MSNDADKCPSCGIVFGIGDWPFCPHGRSRYGIITDDIPGGIEVRHGICNEDGTPKRYYSYSSMRKAAFEKGLTQGNDTPKINQRIVEETERADEARAEHYKNS